MRRLRGDETHGQREAARPATSMSEKSVVDVAPNRNSAKIPPIAQARYGPVAMNDQLATFNSLRSRRS
jgi:hypothetical protein